MAIAGIAYKFERQSLDTKFEVLGKRHPHPIAVMVKVERTWFVQGRYKEAESLAIQILQFRGEILGARHPHTLVAMYQLARTWWQE